MILRIHYKKSAQFFIRFVTIHTFDGRTDRQTEFSSLDLDPMQRGNNLHAFTVLSLDSFRNLSNLIYFANEALNDSFEFISAIQIN